jgi:hypothetical protein
MGNINSNNYHDFVIKNGRLIAEFEQMYQKSKDIPWHQDKLGDAIDVKLAVELLKDCSPFDYICDFGCGLGYFLNILRIRLAKQDCKLTGYDISETCLKKAKMIFPKADYCYFNLRNKNRGIVRDRNGKGTMKRLFCIRGTLWYVFPDMKNVVGNLSGKTEKNDLLLISQNFPPLDSKFVGKEVIPDPKAIVAWFNEDFSPIKTLYYEDKTSKGNDNWFIGVFRRR